MSIIITDLAREYIGKLLNKYPDVVLVVGYDSTGCSGHKYTFSLCSESKIPENVESIDVPNGRVIVSPESIEGLSNATLDLHVDGFDQYLVWDNPSAISSCGCGDSFQLPNES